MALLSSSLTPIDWGAIDAVVHSASSSQIDQAFARLGPNLLAGQWLGPRHKMRFPKQALKGLSLPFDVKISQQVSEYAAATVALHIADALSYFGRAMSALTSGSIEIAQHLLYYSELRATHALLARNGILVIANKNFVINSSGVATEIPISNGRISGNPHQSLWVAFSAWARDPRTTDFGGSQILASGTPLSDWADARAVATPLSAVFPSLLKQWGLDLERFGEDRELRNRLSYDPTRLKLIEGNVSPRLIESLFSQAWSLFEPQALNPFENLDLYLVRQSLEALHRLNYSSSPTLRSAAYRRLNRAMADGAVGVGAGDFVVDFLQRPYADPDPEIIDLADIDPASGKSLEDKVTGMIGRCLILARFGLGAMRDLLEQTSTSPDAMRFWLDDLLLRRAIPTSVILPARYSDMHDDIDDHLAAISAMRGFSFTNDLPVISQRFGYPIMELCGFERVAAWSVAS